MADLDDIDLKLIEVLQQGGRTRRNELAEQVGLSLPAVSDRLRKLEENGVITGYYAKVNSKELGKDITAFIVVSADSSKHYRQLIDHANAADEVLECHAITGQGSHLLKIRTENTSTLEKLLAKIQSWPGVTGTMTSVVLSTMKETFRIRVNNHNKH